MRNTSTKHTISCAKYDQRKGFEPMGLQKTKRKQSNTVFNSFCNCCTKEKTVTALYEFPPGLWKI